MNIYKNTLASNPVQTELVIRINEQEKEDLIEYGIDCDCQTTFCDLMRTIVKVLGENH